VGIRGLTILSYDIHLDPPISHAIADAWTGFGDKHAEAHIAFHFGALYVLQIVEQVVARWPL
jgi:hypothetical protein